jgi:hypothetical protein
LSYSPLNEGRGQVNSAQIEVSNASSFEKPHADAVQRLSIAIDRRTGVLIEDTDTLKADNPS